MATSEAEYDSDPEELNRSLATRRREASDDDSDDDDAVRDVKNQRAVVDSDLSDEEVGTVKYDNDEDGEDSYEDEEEESGGGIDNDKSGVVKEAGDMNGEEENEKEKLQAAVPTGGAFYMHDDRFQEMSAGGNRFTLFTVFVFHSFLNQFCFKICHYKLSSINSTLLCKGWIFQSRY